MSIFNEFKRTIDGIIREMDEMYRDSNADINAMYVTFHGKLNDRIRKLSETQAPKTKNPTIKTSKYSIEGLSDEYYTALVRKEKRQEFIDKCQKAGIRMRGKPSVFGGISPEQVYFEEEDGHFLLHEIGNNKYEVFPVFSIFGDVGTMHYVFEINYNFEFRETGRGRKRFPIQMDGPSQVARPGICKRIGSKWQLEEKGEVHYKYENIENCIDLVFK